MRYNISSVRVIVKTGHDRAAALALEIGAACRDLGVPCAIMENLPGAGAFGFIADGSVLPGLIFVLGGDGTILSVARKLKGKPVPLIGINLGRLGFMAELASDDWRPFLEDVVRNGIRTMSRMLLRFKIRRRGLVEEDGLVTNDIVINRGGLARLVQLRVSIGGEVMGAMRADGLIISTPNGSTAYCVSAGGPLVHPGVEAVTLVPICPFMGRFMPLVVGAEEKIAVTIEESSAEVLLTRDGQKGMRLEAGDIVEVTRAEERLLLAVAGGNSYISRLRDKGFFVDWTAFGK